MGGGGFVLCEWDIHGGQWTLLIHDTNARSAFHGVNGHVSPAVLHNVDEGVGVAWLARECGGDAVAAIVSDGG